MVVDFSNEKLSDSFERFHLKHILTVMFFLSTNKIEKIGKCVYSFSILR